VGEGFAWLWLPPLGKWTIDEMQLWCFVDLYKAEYQPKIHKYHQADSSLRDKSTGCTVAEWAGIELRQEVNIP